MIALLRPRPRPTPTPAREACAHPADALTSRPAGRLSRTVVQQCQCGAVTGALEP